VTGSVISTDGTGSTDGRAAFDVHSQPGAVPRLDEGQLDVLRRYGLETPVGAGEVLFSPGENAAAMFVVLDGAADVIIDIDEPDERVLVTYTPGEFIGELGLLTGQRLYATGRMHTDGRVLRIPVEALRIVMAQEAELSELILRAFLLRRGVLTSIGSGITLVGSRFDADTRRLLQVLSRNRLASRWLDLETMPEAEALLQNLHVGLDELPLVVVPGGALLRNPTQHELLAEIGIAGFDFADDPEGVCDLLVVGGGPGGLAAAVYGASEGLSTTLIDTTAFGGQAGTSSRIENYLGFPAGLSGAELTARAALQAEKFGVRLRQAATAVALTSENGLHRVDLDTGESVTAKSVIIATGARYTRLDVDRFSEFEGVGIYYAATQMEAQACIGQPVAVVGGGNSAGQAALFLARTCRTVQLIIRGSDLAASMSRYLIDQIEHHPRIEVMSHTEVTALLGDEELAAIELTNNQDQRAWTLISGALFIFVGARPSTDWLGGQLAIDEHGFIRTGADVPAVAGSPTPLVLETSTPSIFCVGDARSGSIKRVATAIGEGSMAVRLVFERQTASGEV
jgi:thioredoxin reductase (NADPH)